MITIERKYIEEIKQVCGAASARSTIQAFENVLIETGENIVKLKAGDSLIEITNIIPCSVKSGFATTVNAGKFLQAFSACGGDVTLVCKDDLTIKSGRRKFNLPTISAESYPAYPESGELEEIKTSGVIAAIKKVAWASAKDDVRYQLNGVYIGKHAAATNGHKMALANLGLNKSAIIPIHSVQKLPDIDGSLYLSDSIFCIKSDSSEFKVKLVDGKFPDYEKLEAETNKFISVNLSEFRECVKAAAITANSKFKSVIFKFGKDSTVEATSQDKRESSVIGFECQTDYEFEFAVNSSYLIESISGLSCETLDIGFSDNQMIIDAEGVKSIIMMVRS